jgi:hypothetical protein
MSVFDSFKEDFGIHLKRLSELNSSSGQTEGGAQNLEEMGRHLIDDLIELSKNDAIDSEICSLALKEIDLFQRTLDYTLNQGGGDINQKRQEVAYVNKLFYDLKESLKSEFNNNKVQQNAAISPNAYSAGSPSINLDVFHATSTGANLENINSFLGGVRTNIAQGYGQGQGFYVWTSKKLAFNHIEFIKENIKGYPLIITINANINPDDWDIDYEVNEISVMSFIYDHFELFKKIPDRAIMTETWGYLLPSLCTTKVRSGTQQIIVFQFQREGSNATLSKGCWANNPDPDTSIGMGELAGSLVNYMQKAFQGEIKTFELEFFKKNVFRGTAIKYVGSKTLPVKQMEAFVNGLWIDALELLKK